MWPRSRLAARQPVRDLYPHPRAVGQLLQLLQQRDVLVPRFEVVTSDLGAGTVDAVGRADNLLGIRRIAQRRRLCGRSR